MLNRPYRPYPVSCTICNANAPHAYYTGEPYVCYGCDALRFICAEETVNEEVNKKSKVDSMFSSEPAESWKKCHLCGGMVIASMYSMHIKVHNWSNKLGSFESRESDARKRLNELLEKLETDSF